MRKEGDFQPVVDYAEYLLDKVRDLETLSALQVIFVKGTHTLSQLEKIRKICDIKG